MLRSPELNLSGDRLTAVYRITGNEEEARQKAIGVCLEQTVEFPQNLVPQGAIKNEIVGRLESLTQLDAQSFEARISYAVETTAFELTQLINVLFGNTSIKPGIRLVRFDLPDSLAKAFKGPRFGRSGLRQALGVHDRALLCTALKPMGLTARQLADLAYQFALGGIDIIKDDHGLTDQPFSRFSERVALCSEAVAKANQETGGRAIYMPNVTAPAHLVMDRAREAKAAGAGGLLFCPGISGFDTMRALADDDGIALPIMSHPAFLGSFTTAPDNGVSHGCLYGQLMRLAGADATVYPNYGGRFSFSREECKEIADATCEAMGSIESIFPTPGGGMTVQRVDEIVDFYGTDVILLIGGDLFQHGADLVSVCREFRQRVERPNEP